MALVDFERFNPNPNPFDQHLLRYINDKPAVYNVTNHSKTSNTFIDVQYIAT